MRERVWALLQRERAARFPGARGRIRNFVGAERAAERLARRTEWQPASVLKANPDMPQLPVRRSALADAKTVYMAVPRLRDEKPFVRLIGDATIKGAMREGRPASVADLGHVDLVVCGTVAVNHQGVRVGKGGGYSDLELALLVEAGQIDERTVIATTVHELQLLDQELPESAHDFRVDLVVTPDRVIEVDAPRRPPGIVWDQLDESKIEEIPVLAALAKRR